MKLFDTGKGIAPEFLPHLFERFKQAESAQTRSIGGLGLGLAIAKQLTEMHGGTISAESRGANQGATFTVHLPLPRIASARRATSQQSSSAAAKTKPLHGRRILLVEDNADTIKAIGIVLRSAGARVIPVTSGQAAFEAFERDRPDVIVSDIAMPGMDGNTLMQKIRALESAEKSRPVPAVALSAFTREEDRAKALSSGFNVHVPKPVDTEQLMATLSELCG